MQLTCPKCQGAMRQYERSGIHVDQCTECRGIFLDRGELERLVDAEAAFNAPPPAAAPARAAAPPPSYSYDRDRDRDKGYDRDRGHSQSYGSGYGHHPKRKKSFFEELFD
jgi:Zn-finger nucleic acid-binding protein